MCQSKIKLEPKKTIKAETLNDHEYIDMVSIVYLQLYYCICYWLNTSGWTLWSTVLRDYQYISIKDLIS